MGAPYQVVIRLACPGILATAGLGIVVVEVFVKPDVAHEFEVLVGLVVAHGLDELAYIINKVWVAGLSVASPVVDGNGAIPLFARGEVQEEVLRDTFR